MAVDDRQGPFSGPAVLQQEITPILSEPAALGGIFQQQAHLVIEIVPIGNRQPSLGLADQGGDLLEVLHVRPVNDRLAEQRSFKDVVPAHRYQAAADEDDVGQGIEGEHFPDGVDQQHIAGLQGLTLAINSCTQHVTQI